MYFGSRNISVGDTAKAAGGSALEHGIQGVAAIALLIQKIRYEQRDIEVHQVTQLDRDRAQFSSQRIAEIAVESYRGGPMQIETGDFISLSEAIAGNTVRNQTGEIGLVRDKTFGF